MNDDAVDINNIYFLGSPIHENVVSIIYNYDTYVHVIL